MCYNDGVMTKPEKQPHRIEMVVESSFENANGVSTAAKYSVDHLLENDYDVRIVTPKPVNKHHEYHGAHINGADSVKLMQFPVGVATKNWTRHDIEKFKPDIVDVRSPFSRLGWGAVWAAQKLEIPSVAVYQTDIDQYIRRLYTMNVKKFFPAYKWLRDAPSERLYDALGQRFALIHNTADRTLAPSEASIKHLKDVGVDEEKIHLWQRGVDMVLHNPQRKNTETVKKLHATWSDNDRRPVIGYVGRLAPEKRVERFAALAELNAQIVIVGSGPMRNELQVKLPNDTIFTGKLVGDEKADAYAAFDVFVHTGTEETFGQTLQEAAATELPVVAPASGGPLDIVKPGETGFLFSPENDDALRESVALLLHNETLRKNMGRAALESVVGKTWSVLGDELIEHYNRTYYAFHQ